MYVIEYGIGLSNRNLSLFWVLSLEKIKMICFLYWIWIVVLKWLHPQLSNWTWVLNLSNDAM